MSNKENRIDAAQEAIEKASGGYAVLHDTDQITLDGQFSAAELAAIAEIMHNLQREQKHDPD